MKLTMRFFLLTSIGLLSYLAFLIAYFPAVQAYGLVADHVPGQAYGLSGTIWSGQAAVVEVEGQRLEAVQWRLLPAMLLSGRLGSELQARLPDGRAQGLVSIDRNQRIEASDVRFELPTARLVELSGAQVPGRIGGQFDVSMRELAIENGQLSRADGIISWHQASVTLGRTLPLGSLNLRLQPAAEGHIEGILISQGGVLDTSGELQIRPDGGFALQMQTSARADSADNDVLPVLHLLGIPADGSPIRSRLTGFLDGRDLLLEEVR